VLELRLNELLCHEQMKNPKLAINLPEGFVIVILLFIYVKMIKIMI